jgi:XTP/dITP diphosphohydrolase
VTGGRPRWVIATGNGGKIREFRALLEGCALELVPQSEFKLAGPPETATSFVENALIKARYAAAHSGLPAIADDSGLLVDALAGAPGIHSARFAGADADDAANVRKLLELLRDFPADARGAHFHCVIVALRGPEDPVPIIAEGRWQGRIQVQPAGSGGFGYDPVFYDPSLGATAAELDAPTKNRVSHRGRALAALVGRLSGGLRGA